MCGGRATAPPAAAKAAPCYRLQHPTLGGWSCTMEEPRWSHGPEPTGTAF
jgi:hypothetical protein